MRTRVHARFVTVLVTGVWSTRRGLFELGARQVGVDGGADEACGDEEPGIVPEGTTCFSLRRCGSFDRTALELDTEN